MTDTVWIVLIVAIAVVFVVVLLRKQLSRLLFKGGGIEAEVETHHPDDMEAARPGSVNVRGNRLVGKRHGIVVERDEVDISDNKLKGEDNEIVIRPDKPAQR